MSPWCHLGPESGFKQESYTAKWKEPRWFPKHPKTFHSKRLCVNDSDYVCAHVIDVYTSAVPGLNNVHSAELATTVLSASFSGDPLWLRANRKFWQLAPRKKHELACGGQRFRKRWNLPIKNGMIELYISSIQHITLEKSYRLAWCSSVRTYPETQEIVSGHQSLIVMDKWLCLVNNMPNDRGKSGFRVQAKKNGGLETATFRAQIGNLVRVDDKKSCGCCRGQVWAHHSAGEDVAPKCVRSTGSFPQNSPPFAEIECTCKRQKSCMILQTRRIWLIDVNLWTFHRLVHMVICILIVFTIVTRHVSQEPDILQQIPWTWIESCEGTKCLEFQINWGIGFPVRMVGDTELLRSH